MNTQDAGRKGGQARSERKAKANREKSILFWDAVRAGLRPAPKHTKKGETTA